MERPSPYVLGGKADRHKLLEKDPFCEKQMNTYMTVCVEKCQKNAHKILKVAIFR